MFIYLFCLTGTTRLQDGEFMWSKTRQNLIFDTYAWGYIVAQVPAGWLAQRFGGKRVFGYFLLAASLSTALVPIASRTHFFTLIALRFIGGVGAVSRPLSTVYPFTLPPNNAYRIREFLNCL